MPPVADLNFVAEVRRKFRAYRRNDKAAGHTDTLSGGDAIMFIIFCSQLVCMSCGVALRWTHQPNCWHQYSFDRHNNTLGHSLHNMWITCLNCNVSHRNESSEDRARRAPAGAPPGVPPEEGAGEGAGAGAGRPPCTCGCGPQDPPPRGADDSRRREMLENQQNIMGAIVAVQFIYQIRCRSWLPAAPSPAELAMSDDIRAVLGLEVEDQHHRAFLQSISREAYSNYAMVILLVQRNLRQVLHGAFDIPFEDIPRDLGVTFDLAP